MQRTENSNPGIIYSNNETNRNSNSVSNENKSCSNQSIEEALESLSETFSRAYDFDDYKYNKIKKWNKKDINERKSDALIILDLFQRIKKQCPEHTYNKDASLEENIKNAFLCLLEDGFLSDLVCTEENKSSSALIQLPLYVTTVPGTYRLHIWSNYYGNRSPISVNKVTNEEIEVLKQIVSMSCKVISSTLREEEIEQEAEKFSRPSDLR